jgi:hypothetical protein
MKATQTHGSVIDEYLPTKLDTCRSCLLVRQSGQCLTASQEGDTSLDPPHEKVIMTTRPGKYLTTA